MKFSEMPYARPDLNELKQQLQALTDRLKAAPDYAPATSSMTPKRSSGTKQGLSFAPMTTRGRLPCSKARSARNSRRNTAI